MKESDTQVVAGRDDVASAVSAAREAIAEATSLDALDQVRSSHLGKRSVLAAVQRTLGGLSADARRALGAAINAARAELADLEAARRVALEAERDAVVLAEEAVDVTLPARIPRRGSLHPVHETTEAIVDVLVGLGYKVLDGPEVETDWHNFTALNSPPDHPAKSLSDTIYVQPLTADARPTPDGTTGILLRPQTSPGQIRVMHEQPPPLYIVIPGQVYRADTADATHLPMFHQIEGLAIDTALSFTDLKGTVAEFARAILGPDTELRFVPDHFPFTEPSAQLLARYDGGWMELLGCGMVHPNVLRAGGYDPEAVRGFAWGLGVDRMAMLRHGVTDMRQFVDNDMRFLASFA
ncbi:MAG: phenylalanine--tRNA ligase subunit alpha [Actinobacteria bacterium]|nr:phenylalanine--tRNA ligase subunit alpha [Actinomycetota bacterium]